MPLERLDGLARLRIPQNRSVVIRPGEHLLAVAAEHDGVNRAVVAECNDQFRRRLPPAWPSLQKAAGAISAIETSAVTGKFQYFACMRHSLQQALGSFRLLNSRFSGTRQPPRLPRRPWNTNPQPADVPCKQRRTLLSRPPAPRDGLLQTTTKLRLLGMPQSIESLDRPKPQLSRRHAPINRIPAVQLDHPRNSLCFSVIQAQHLRLPIRASRLH